jgi:hypothetical protein
MIQCSRVSGSLGGEIADVIAALFVRRLRCGRGEFLEAGIVPNWIEHRSRRSRAGVSGARVLCNVQPRVTRRGGQAANES